MTGVPPLSASVDSRVLAAVGSGIATGNFEAALSAVQSLVDSGFSSRPVSEVLTDICFRLELERSFRGVKPDFDFSGIASLYDQGICTGAEVNRAIYSALFARGRIRGSLEGELHDMLMRAAAQSRSRAIMDLAIKIPRDAGAGSVQ